MSYIQRVFNKIQRLDRLQTIICYRPACLKLSRAAIKALSPLFSSRLTSSLNLGYNFCLFLYLYIDDEETKVISLAVQKIEDVSCVKFARTSLPDFDVIIFYLYM